MQIRTENFGTQSMTEANVCKEMAEHSEKYYFAVKINDNTVKVVASDHWYDHVWRAFSYVISSIIDDDYKFYGDAKSITKMLQPDPTTEKTKQVANSLVTRSRHDSENDIR